MSRVVSGHCGKERTLYNYSKPANLKTQEEGVSIPALTATRITVQQVRKDRTVTANDEIGPASAMSDNGSSVSRRSSSQTSRASSDSKRAKTLRANPKRALSKASSSSLREVDPSLTSFPSFSPEPESRPPQGVEELPKVTRTISQKARDRKATLAGLTNASPGLDKQAALFDDTPRSSLDLPGSLHLANDSHIERLVAKNGAVNLLRQYAKDLALRDAELSALRVRADTRERELKRLLREADVPSAEIEKRLLKLEHGNDGERNTARAKLNGLMDEAITAQMASGLAATTVREIEYPKSPASGRFSPQSQKSPTKFDLLKANTIAASRNSSRASSILSETSLDLDATLRPQQTSSNSTTSKALNLQNIFTPPAQGSSYFIGGSRTVRKQKAADEVSVRSSQSTKSFTSWTQIFGVKSQTTRSRAASLEPGQTAKKPSEAESALAKLSKPRIHSVPNPQHVSTGTARQKPANGRRPMPTRLSASPSHSQRDSNSSGLPLTVEMDSVLEPETLPPTMTSSLANPNGLLVDRFGFIYDQRRRKRDSLQVSKHKRNKPSGSSGLRGPSVSDADKAPPTSVPADEEAGKKSWQDYLKPVVNAYTSRPKELLSQMPAASAIVTVSTADATGTITPPRAREASVAVSASGLDLLPASASVSEPQPSCIVATSIDPTQDDESESVSSKMLLDQLNELHDALQAERMAKWNDFLRKVRAERASSADHTSKNVPEADLLEGELIGIATLGRSPRQRAKYTHFKSLVLMGIPVALRPKIWAECSGATARRIPGYYEDLVAKSQRAGEIDADIVSQIDADIRRTLTDNVFFHSPQPGVKRLREVLLAYSKHNEEIGYCQGMNLIAASLILICATPEDCFWLLVAVIDTILPSGYFSGSLLTARADQIVLREYVSELLPALSAKLDQLGVELGAITFHWFLSLYASVLTGGEALYRIWDIILTLHSSEELPNFTAESRTANLNLDLPSATGAGATTATTNITTAATAKLDNQNGTSSPFLFQLALSLLYLNSQQIMALDSAAQVYTFINHNLTNHSIALDSLIKASEGLCVKVKRSDVLEKRRRAIESLAA
ncbi:hypothetical protein DV738_g3420, partial [Chaetothyriales sp. CBS 135597]